MTDSFVELLLLLLSVESLTVMVQLVLTSVTPKTSDLRPQTEPGYSLGIDNVMI